MDPGGGDPLADVELWRKQGQFGEQGNGAGGADAGDAVQVAEALLQEGIGSDELNRLLGQALQSALLKGNAAPDLLANRGGERSGGAGSVQAVLFGGAQIGDRLDAPGQRAQAPCGRRRRLLGTQV